MMISFQILYRVQGFRWLLHLSRDVEDGSISLITILPDLSLLTLPLVATEFNKIPESLSGVYAQDSLTPVLISQ